jgi:hypothetical protein
VRGTLEQYDGKSLRAKNGKLPLSTKKAAVFLLTAVVLTVSLALLIGEVFVRMTRPQNLSGSWRTANDAGLFVHCKNIVSRHQFGGRVVSYRFNAVGHRDYGASPASERVLVLGDSFTFGWLLNDADIYVAHLQRRIDTYYGIGRFELINAGHGGWGASDYVRYYEDYGADLDISAVLIFMNTDDIGRSLRAGQYSIDEGSAKLKKRYGVHRNSRSKQLLSSIPGYSWMLHNSHLLQIGRNFALGHHAPPEPGDTIAGPVTIGDFDKRKAVSLGVAIFDRLASISVERNHPIQVLTTGWFKEELSADVDPTRAFYREAERVFGELGIPYADISPIMKNRVDMEGLDTWIPGDGHPNETGARLIAELNWPHVLNHLDAMVSGNSTGQQTVPEGEVARGEELFQ